MEQPLEGAGCATYMMIIYIVSRGWELRPALCFGQWVCWWSWDLASSTIFKTLSLYPIPQIELFELLVLTADVFRQLSAATQHRCCVISASSMRLFSRSFKTSCSNVTAEIFLISILVWSSSVFSHRQNEMQCTDGSSYYESRSAHSPLKSESHHSSSPTLLSKVPKWKAQRIRTSAPAGITRLSLVFGQRAMYQ